MFGPCLIIFHVQGELIEVVEMTVAEVKEYMSSPRVDSPSTFLFAVTWFLANRTIHVHN
jgi:UDP-sugar diphosphatase